MAIEGWTATIRRIVDDEEVFSLTICDECVGTLLGRLLRAAVEEDNENSPVYFLLQLIWALDTNAVSFQEDVLRSLAGLLDAFQNDDNGEVEDLVRIMGEMAAPKADDHG